MHEKTARRRRAALAALVALSLILLTVYFGESPGGRLHAVQGDFLTVVSPIQDGANKALKPVRDLFNGIGSTLHAKSQRNALAKQVGKLNRELVAEQALAHRGTELESLLALDNQLGIGSYSPVSASVDGVSYTLWYSTVNIDKGSDDGIRVDDPVINEQGLVGKVTLVVSDAAQVTLITDQSSGVAAAVAKTGDRGLIQPKVGDPENLELQDLPTNAVVSPGDEIDTAGSIAGQAPSLFPPGIPIGQVTSVDDSVIPATVYVKPLADLRRLDVVQVLTRGTSGVASQTVSALGELPPAGSEPTSSSGPADVQQAASGSGSGG